MNTHIGSSHTRGRRFGALLISVALALPSFAQTAQPQRPLTPEEEAAQKKVPVEVTDKPAGDTLVLSPFQVVADTKGYYSANTMSGTRLNSRIEDLGQSITVMTKEQMSDFAMLDINDVFDYMAGTEGTGSYSAFEVDRTGAVTDNVSLDRNNANRVRGIGNANIAFNNIAVSGRVPVDPLWMDSLELSRGPNANIFGLGNTSGTVNQVPATANLTRDFTRSEARVDSYEGYRASIDVNRMLIANKVALRASYAYDHIGFVRKPSGEDIRRLSFQAKVQPWKNTTIAASYYGYANKATRPNYTTPRDYVSSYIAAGRPGWNPVTRLITLNGVSYGQGAGGTLQAGSTTPITTLPLYFTGNDNRGVFRIGAEGETPYYSAPSSNTSTTTPQASTNSNQRFVNTAPGGFFGAAQPLFASIAAVSDKSLYDWENINLMGNNRQWDDVDTYMAQLDQVILHTPKHTLAAQVTYMLEDAKQIQDQPMGVASVNSTIGQLQIDPNTHNLDGSVNPYFGRPYLKTTEPFLRDKPLRWETVRAQAVYRLDFTQDRGLSKWLGTQQLLGYYEYKDQQTRQYTWRDTPTGLNVPWIKAVYDAGVPMASRSATGTRYAIPAGNVQRLFEQYYVGSTPGGAVEYAPSLFPEGVTLPLVWGTTGSWHYDQVTMAMTPSPDGAGALNNTQLITKTEGGVLQSFLFGGRLVTTIGLRTDEVSSRNAPFAYLTPDLRDFDYALSNEWSPPWRVADGKTKTFSAVARPFRDWKFVTRNIDNGSGATRFLAEAVNGLSLTYNKSDNFIPQGPAVDLFQRELPNQTGKTRDVGFWLTLLDGKLNIRYTHFKTEELNKRNGDINTIAQRILRADGLVASDPHNLQDRSTEWITQLNPGFTPAQIQAAVATTMGLTQDQIDGLANANNAGALAATQDVVSKGDELEISYNPSRNWTVSASMTKTESINQNAGSTIEDWANLRMPVWTTVEDPRFTTTTQVVNGAVVPYAGNVTVNLPTGATGHLLWRYIAGAQFTAFGYNGTTSAIANYTTFVAGPLAVYRQLEGRPRPQLAKYSAKFNTRYNLSGITDNRYLKNMTVGGSVRWIDKAAIGFYGVQSLPAMVTALDVNRPIYSKAQYPVDLFVTYNTKLWNDKVRARFQLNVKNVQENGGGLRMTQAFPDGTGLSYRIIDPRQFILSAAFDF